MATNVDAKLLKQTKFPLEFNQKVDMKKVNVEVMKKWIAGKISEILGSEDDVVIELCFNLLEGSRFLILRSYRFSSPVSWIRIPPNSAGNCGTYV